jgi:O-methyltransferase
MNNYFITEPPYSVNKRRNVPFINFVNKGLRFLKTGYNVQQLDTSVDMNTLEQRINYYHLLDNVITSNIPGDVIELGTFTGQCALLFQKMIELHQSDKKLHVFDTFGVSFKFKGDIEEKLKSNFITAELTLPVTHKGDFFKTLPAELPAVLSFIHIDCGFGGDPLEHKKVMMHCLESIYPKMAPGALCVLMDYNDPAENGIAHNVAPGVKLACDEFLAGKPESIMALYGNQYLHAYFKKL